MNFLNPLSASRFSLILFVYALYFLISYQALSGPFILDDFYNLSFLQQFNDNKELNFLNWITSSPGGLATNRYFSYFTFIAQHESWMGSPFNFKLINLLIHLLNASLVIILSWMIFGKIYPNSKAQFSFSFISGFIWLIHPIQQSTVFYTIQRMTELSALFIFLGLICIIILIGKIKLQNFKQLFFLLTTTALFVLFGIFSKENAVLLMLQD